MMFKNEQSLRVQRNSIRLSDGDSLHLRKRAGTLLHVYADARPGGESGLLWITEEGCLDDVFVRPGQCHAVRGRGRVVATAWGPLQLRVLSPREVLAQARDQRARERAERSERDGRAMSRDSRGIVTPPSKVAPCGALRAAR